MTQLPISRLVLSAAIACGFGGADIVYAQEGKDDQLLDVITVTAQKREQSINDVGMSITAASGDVLLKKGVTSPEDLIRIVPGFTYTMSQFDFPTYTLRGVGFYDSGLTAPPAVSVYVDQISLPYPAMTRGAILDLERVEVLKGPQGTLFGQNSTGGAINYIAAKPTSTFSAGGRLSFSSFNTIEGEGFISGPVSEALKYRLAVKGQTGDGWQHSVTRPGDKLGKKEFFAGRFLVDFEPAEGLSLHFNLNGWKDKSDTVAPQAVEIVPVVPGIPLPPTVVAISPGDAQKADWNAGEKFRRNNDFFQASLRGEVDLSTDVKIVSLTSYQEYNQYAYTDADGTPAFNLHTIPKGYVNSFSQELRLEGKLADDLTWLVGGNYQKDKAHDNQIILLGQSTGAVTPFGSFDSVINDARNKISNWAVFGNAEFEINNNFTLIGGLRYAKNKVKYNACSLDSGAGDLTSVFSAIQQFVLGVPVTVVPGGCLTLRDDVSPSSAQFLTTTRYSDSLSEDNVSWRVGVNIRPFDSDALIYGTISQGYKSGSFPIVSAQLASQLSAAKQEKLLAYELGVKAPIRSLALQLNGAIFHYDYTNKQIRGRIQTFFGQLEKLVNIPRSTITGAEVEMNWRPVSGFTIAAAATYIDSKIGKNSDGTPYLAFPQRTHGQVPVSGQNFPFTPKWAITGDVTYEWRLSSSVKAFLGAGLTYQSRSKGGLERSDPSQPLAVSNTDIAGYNDTALIIPQYALIDLRAGIEGANGAWSATAWVKNLTNKYYLLNTIKTQDTLLNYPGQPFTAGVTLKYRY